MVLYGNAVSVAAALNGFSVRAKTAAPDEGPNFTTTLGGRKMRKQLALTLGAALLAAPFAVGNAGSAAAAGAVNLLTWEGYADDSFIKPFEAASGC